MSFLWGMIFGGAVEEVTCYYGWFGSPHHPFITALGWGTTSLVIWLLRKPLTRWVNS